MLSALLITLIVIVDQLTKYFAKVNFYGGNDYSIIDGFFSLTYLENRGAAFGIFEGQKLVTIGFASIVIILLIIFLYKSAYNNKWMRTSLVLIIGGAIGNLIDRAYLGYVVDFFHFYAIDIFDFPIFNVADISVVCGTFLMALTILFSKEDWRK